MTANNITYAVFGKPAGLFGNDQGYWDFFAERGEPGRLPVWGFATVIESAAEGVAGGDRFFGYYPTVSDAVLTVGTAGPDAFTEQSPRPNTRHTMLHHYHQLKAGEGPIAGPR